MHHRDNACLLLQPFSILSEIIQEHFDFLICNWIKRPQDPAEHNVCVFSHFLLHHHRDKGSQNKVDLSVQKGSLLPTQTDLLSKYIFLFPRSCWSWWQFERAQRLFCKAFKLMWKWKDVLSSSRSQKSCSQKMSFVRPAACYGFWTPDNIMSKVFLKTPTFIEWTEKRLETLLKEPASLFDGFIIWLETHGGQKEEKSELHVRSIILGKSLLLTCLMCQKKEYHTTYITTKRNWSRPKRKIFYSEIRLKVKIASISHSTFLWGETALKKVNGLFWTRNWKNI